MLKPFVIVIAGPTGVGKTELVTVIKRHYDCLHLSEDDLARKLFADTYKDVEDHPDKVRRIVRELFKIASNAFEKRESVVIDMINLEQEFVNEIKKSFGKKLIIKVLWPPIETTIERDINREGWTSGKKTIRRFYKEYEKLIPIIGKENYINNNHQTPDETFIKFIKPNSE